MPIATINILEGRGAEKKLKLIESVSRAISESLDAPMESVRVLVQEYPASHWGVSGETMQQRHERQQ